MACACSEATARLLIHLLYRMLPNSAMAHADWRITLHVTIRGGGGVQRRNSSTAHESAVAHAQQWRYDYAYKRSTCREAQAVERHVRATAPLRIDRLLRLGGGAMAHTDTRMTLHVA